MDNPISVGVVSAVFPERATATVYFESLNVTSRELHIGVHGTTRSQEYWMPAVGESVLCLFLSDKSREGFIVCSYYNEVDKPPSTSVNKRVIRFEDGTGIEYDSQSKVMSINAKGPIQIKSGGNVHVEGDVIADGVSLKNHTH